VQARASEIEGRKGASTRRHADDAPALDWLERMGVVTVDENGAWSLTELGQGAMARFHKDCALSAVSPVTVGI